MSGEMVQALQNVRTEGNKENIYLGVSILEMSKLWVEKFCASKNLARGLEQRHSRLTTDTLCH